MKTLDAQVDAIAAATPDKTAIKFGGQAISYASFAEQIARTAGFLRQRGVETGDRIAYLGLNHSSEIVLQFAAARTGAMFLPLNWRLSAAELRFIVENAAPKVCFCDVAYCGVMRAIESNAIGLTPDCGLNENLEDRLSVAPKLLASDIASPDSPVQLVYTSGTTGRPKGAVLTQRSVHTTALMGADMYGLTPDDNVLNFLPLFHVGGMNIHSIPALLSGATLTLHDRFDVSNAIASLANDSITLTNLVPTILEALIAHPDWPKAARASLRAVSIGSTDVPVSLTEKLGESGLPLLQIYGATETGPTAIYQTNSSLPTSKGSIGQVGKHCEVKICDPSGTELAPNISGEICVKGGNTFSHYWKNPVATAETISDGWVKTGDVAYCDNAGNYWFTDRLKHIIISGGENIYPAELKRLTNTLDTLAESTIIGVPDPKWGEVPVVVAVRKNPETSQEVVLSVFDGGIAKFKRPRRVVFVDALPRNVMGKVVVDDVRKLLSELGAISAPFPQ
jgi:fatty-acyl-CoA synthase